MCFSVPFLFPNYTVLWIAEYLIKQISHVPSFFLLQLCMISQLLPGFCYSWLQVNKHNSSISVKFGKPKCQSCWTALDTSTALAAVPLHCGSAILMGRREPDQDPHMLVFTWQEKRGKPITVEKEKLAAWLRISQSISQATPSIFTAISYSSRNSFLNRSDKSALIQYTKFSFFLSVSVCVGGLIFVLQIL